MPLIKSTTLLNEEKIEHFLRWIERIYDTENVLCGPLTKAHLAHIPINDQRRESRDFNAEQLSNLTGIDFSKYISFSGGVIDHNVNGYLEGSFIDGIPHGFFRKFNKFGDLQFFGCFVEGIVVGPCWKSLIGGGLLISNNPHFSGTDVIYLYADCRTALIGEFYNGIMVKAGATELIGTTYLCQEHCEILKPEFCEIEGPMYTREVSTESSITSTPLLSDPYERHFVVVQDSLIEHAGEGLFAITDIDTGTAVSFYNGIRVKTGTTEDSPYKVAVGENYELDIPPEFTSIDDYCATLGHKICHSFSPNCEFEPYDHPRFGLIIAVFTLRNIKEGEELTVNYKYDLNNAPSWYKKLWAKHQKRVRGMPSWQTILSRRTV